PRRFRPAQRPGQRHRQIAGRRSAGAGDAPQRRKLMINPHSAAQRHLSRRDRVLKRLISLVGDCVLRPQTDLFAALVRSIVAQQISTKAAQSISARLIAGPCAGTLTPAALVVAPEEDLRAAGLSTAKRRSLRDLAERVHSGTLRLDM